MNRPARILLALAAVAAATPALAGLGEPASSIAGDEAKLAAARRLRAAQATPTHRVEELVSEGRTVREYVSPDGVVFAVCWEGVSHPDLAAILGSYTGPVRSAIGAQGAPPRGRARRVEADGAVVETWGHMRDVHGRAWVPALVPAGVSLDEIR